MATDTDIFGNPLFNSITFNENKEGIVVGNDHLESDGYIDVFIYELMVDSVPQISQVTNKSLPDEDNSQKIFKWLDGLDSFLSTSGVINDIGLVSAKFIEDDPYTSYNSPSTSTSETQVLLARACLRAYLATNESKWFDRAKLLTNGYLNYYYADSNIPAVPKKTWIPHWLVNVTHDFNARSFELNNSINFVNGEAKFQINNLIKVISVRSLDAKMEYDTDPYSKIIGTSYEISSQKIDFKTGEADIKLSTNFNGNLLIAYSYTSDEVIKIGDKCESYPVWRHLLPGEIACAADSLSWTLDLYTLWYQITNDKKWKNAIDSTKYSILSEINVNNLNYYLNLNDDSVSFINNDGITEYSDRNNETFTNENNNIVKIDIPESKGQTVINRWVSNSTPITSDNYIKGKIGSNSISKIYVYIDLNKDYDPSNRYFSIVWLKGMGLQDNELEEITFKPEDFYQYDNVFWGSIFNQTNEINFLGDSNSSLSSNDIIDDINGKNLKFTRINFDKSVWVQSQIGHSYGQSLPLNIKYRTNNSYQILINDKNNNQWYFPLAKTGDVFNEITLSYDMFKTNSSSKPEDLKENPINSLSIDSNDSGKSTLDIEYIGKIKKLSDTSFNNIGFGYDDSAGATLAFKYLISSVSQGELPYTPYVMPFDMHLENNSLSTLRGNIYSGYQAPWIFNYNIFNNNTSSNDVNENLKFLSDAQSAYKSITGIDGFFASIFYWNYKNDYEPHTPNTFGMVNEWGNIWGGFQYRTISDVSRVLITDPSNILANNILKKFFNGLLSCWDELDSFPTNFTSSSKPSNDQKDCQMVANLLKALSYSSYYSSSFGSSDYDTINKLKNKCLEYLNKYFVDPKIYPNSKIKGTFSGDANNNDWYEYWGAEIIDSLSIYISLNGIKRSKVENTPEDIVLDNDFNFPTNETEKTIDNSINVNNITTLSSLKFNSSIKSVNFVKCYPIIYRGYMWNFTGKTKLNLDKSAINFKDLPAEIQRAYKPNVGETVTVKFLRGDPKLPYFKYMSYLNLDPIVVPGDDPNSNPDDKKKGDDDVIDPIDHHNQDDDNNKDIYKERGYYRLQQYHKYSIMTGGDILKVKNMLSNNLGYVFKNGTMSIFDESTQAAVYDFQLKHNIEADGVVGPTTYNMLLDVAAIMSHQKN